MRTSVIAPLGDAAADVLGQKLMEFCHLLRAHEIEVTASRIIDTFRALKAIDFFRRGDFYTVLETNLISRVSDRELFHQLFLQFWSGPTWAGIPAPCLPGWEDECALPPHSVQNSRLQLESVAGGDEPDDATARSLTMYSPTEMLSRKDFGKMSEQELMQVQRLISSMAQQMATMLSRRKKARKKAHGIDAGRTLRHSLRYGGEVVRLMRRGPKIGKTKMVLLCDVSGSMDVYTKFLLQFLYGVQNGLRGVETIVFSTRMSRITSLLRRRHIDAALELISEAVHDWSGGTKIGQCLKEFNDTMAPNMVTSKTLVVMISDGWDTGDTAVLDAEMARLRSRAHRIIWLNPLLGNPTYQPLCKGMHTALPYVHDFMPVHSAESLRQFGQLVASVV
ncbi:MAG: VWA domain-containing protein [Candidatus Tectomicrobia bacterium]|nr:VWA domain-containing protein [Candidatus Tectomicrobia bacterium]